MTKMFPFIVKDMKNVLIYLPQALCACGIYAVCYGLVTLITGMLARRLQKNGQQPTEENGGLPEMGSSRPGKTAVCRIMGSSRLGKTVVCRRERHCQNG